MTGKVGFQLLQNYFNFSAQTGQIVSKITCHLLSKCRNVWILSAGQSLTGQNGFTCTTFFTIKPQSSRQDKMSAVNVSADY